MTAMSPAGIGRMSRCLRTTRVLQRYLDGELDNPSARSRVRAHLEECRRCGLDAATYRAIKHSLRTGRHDIDQLALHRLRHFTQALIEHDGTGT
jgi:anti-sigma factor RsiW